MAVLTSDIEGLPNALIEAAISGIPCVATNFPGVDEVIEQGVTGFIAESDNKKAVAKEIAEYIERLLNNKVLRKQMGNAARKSALKAYSIDSLGRQLQQIYADARDAKVS